ncbi:MAG TPA: TraB/GumN family protein [Vicinamibacterales bacterium]|nr:TraB/GumN family protein [Vicinamibacterales bacterium]
MRHRVLSVLVGLVLASAPAFAQKTGGQFMWKVEGPGGSSAFLLGSLHVLTADFYPLNAAINKAFGESRTLVEEIDIDETSDPMVMMAALSKAMLTDGRTLDQIIAPDVYAEVKKRAEKAGLPMAAIQRMKPWLVAITLMAPTLQAAGFKPELGIDRHFFDRAKDAGMKRQGLETMAFQLDQFDSLSPKLQEELLKTTMEDLDKEVTGVKDMAQAWQFGNVTAMEKMTLSELQEAPELYQKLLVDRNRNWIPRIETCLKENAGCFIVVGAAHLVGPDGLPVLLTKKGYKVTQQ